MPTHELISERLSLPLSAVKRTLGKEASKDLLRERGLEVSEDKDLLTPEQILAINLFLDITDKRTMREKLKIINVTQAQWNAWLRQPAVQRYIEKRGRGLFGGVNGLAYTKLVEAVGNGAEWAIKYSFEVNGEYNPRHQDNLDMATMMTRLFEIMARHVEPEKLLEIASELEAVGGPIKMAPALEMRPPVEDAVIISDTGATDTNGNIVDF